MELREGLRFPTSSLLTIDRRHSHREIPLSRFTDARSLGSSDASVQAHRGLHSPLLCSHALVLVVRRLETAVVRVALTPGDDRGQVGEGYDAGWDGAFAVGRRILSIYASARRYTFAKREIAPMANA